MNYSVNLPNQLQREAEQWAATQGVPLDQFILWVVAQKVASLRHELNVTFPVEQPKYSLALNAFLCKNLRARE